MGPFPRTSYVLFVADIFTRWVKAFPLRTSEALKVIQIIEEVFSISATREKSFQTTGRSLLAMRGPRQVASGVANYGQPPYTILEPTPANGGAKS